MFNLVELDSIEPADAATLTAARALLARHCTPDELRQFEIDLRRWWAVREWTVKQAERAAAAAELRQWQEYLDILARREAEGGP